MKFTKEWFGTEGLQIREKYEAADMVKFCWAVGELAYAVTLRDIPHSWVKIERAAQSKGGKLKARIRPNATEKAKLRNLPTCEVLGRMDELTAAYEAAYTKARGKKAPKNLGWVYECAVTERAGQTWEPDSIPFWMAPDVLDNGIGYQVKGDGAEYYTESNLEGCLAAMGC